MTFQSTFRCHVCAFRIQFHSATAQQVRHASLLRRPRRPYTFTQLVTLSDGSSYTQRTTSPSAVQKSTKDTRNAPLWNPSSQKMQGLETDEAGRLRAFRERFGRGYDAERMEDEDKDAAETEEVEDNLMDLIESYGQQAEAEGTAEGVREEKTRAGNGTGGEK